MIFRLAQVLFDGGLQLQVVGGLGHLGQRFHESLLGVVQVLQLVNKQGFERVEISGAKQAHVSAPFEKKRS